MWWELPQIAYIVLGFFADLPSRPERKHHAYFSHDTHMLSASDNDRYWRHFVAPLPAVVDYTRTVPDGVSLVAGRTLITGKLIVEGRVTFV